MRFSLPTPRMVLQARVQSQGHSLGLEVLIFIAVFCLAGLIIEGTLQTIVIVPSLLDPAFLRAVQEQVSRGGAGPSYQGVMEIVNMVLSNPLTMLGLLFSTVGLSAGVLVYCRAIERRSLASMGIRRARALREYLLGGLLGLAFLAAVVGICVITGTLQPQAGGGLSLGLIGILLIFLVGFILQGFSEELLCRGYFMVSLARRQSLPLAVVISSLAFSVLHLMNPGILEQPLAIPNIFMFGAIAGIYLLKRGDIWGAAAMHSLWNFAQGNIFGIQVSGVSKLPSLFSFTAPSATDSPWANLVNGGSFGLEGGLAASLVLAVALVAVLLVPGRQEDAQ
ncbi:MAG: CPBP family intramembrane metalloprotease [Coriobacteriales bacterium]|jgi:membrane protease YdiL (CAAX protease family)|nr:CPBP family intramembrane metalloprotease [Coriobacteriales bacterium]